MDEHVQKLSELEEYKRALSEQVKDLNAEMQDAMTAKQQHTLESSQKLVDSIDEFEKKLIKSFDVSCE